ncbi:MAG: DUF1987 domain-containing protein [Bacteroidota bacterium]
MEKFELNATNKTPEIVLDNNEGKLLVAGRSIPENSVEFYKPVMDWIENYVRKPTVKTIIEIKLEYFNTSSSKCLVEIFRKIEKIQESGSEVQIMWYYEEDDEDMLESGEDFKQIIKVPIEMIEVQDED